MGGKVLLEGKVLFFARLIMVVRMALKTSTSTGHIGGVLTWHCTWQ